MIKPKRKFTWEEIETLVHNIIVQIAPIRAELKGVYGVPRGGLIPAVMISQRTGLQLVDKDRISNDILVVDDITDSGKTLDYIVKNYGATKTATLLFNEKKSIVTPLYFAKYYQDEYWAVFPWETIKSSKYDRTVWKS